MQKTQSRKSSGLCTNLDHKSGTADSRMEGFSQSRREREENELVVRADSAVYYKSRSTLHTKGFGNSRVSRMHGVGVYWVRKGKVGELRHAREAGKGKGRIRYCYTGRRGKEKGK